MFCLVPILEREWVFCLVPILVQLACSRVAPFQQTGRRLHSSSSSTGILLSSFGLSGCSLGLDRNDALRNLPGAILQQIKPAGFALGKPRRLLQTKDIANAEQAC